MDAYLSRPLSSPAPAGMWQVEAVLGHPVGLAVPVPAVAPRVLSPLAETHVGSHLAVGSSYGPEGFRVAG